MIFVQNILFLSPIIRFHFLRTAADDSRKGRKNHNRGYDSGDQIGNALGQIHTIEAERVRQSKVKRDEDNNLYHHGKQERRFGRHFLAVI